MMATWPEVGFEGKSESEGNNVAQITE